MPSPSIPNFNGQIKTPWRGGYTSEAQLSENQAACREAMQDCPWHFIWKNDNLPQFQFVRPFSMTLVTSWGLYDGPGDSANLVVDLDDQIDKLRYVQTVDANGDPIDYVYYVGTLLDELLDAGTYWMRIVTGGITYLWEPVTIVCDTFGINLLPVPVFGGGLETAEFPERIWAVGTWGSLLQAAIVGAGDPTDLALEFEGSQVANLTDNLLYTYTSGAWVSSTPASITNGWYDFATGDWYRYNSGWQGVVTDPLTLDEDGACWEGIAGVPIVLNVGSLGCSEANARITITVEGMTAGTLSVGVPDTGEGITIEDNGTFSFTSFLANGYILGLNPNTAFDGCVTGVEVACAADASDCFYQLQWGNCGNIGNTFLGDGFTNAMYFDQRVYPVTPAPEVIEETKQRPDGSLMPISRRRETRWTMQIGFVPWFIADALADMQMYDTIRLFPVGGGSDVLTGVEVAVDWIDGFGECLADVTITFQIDAATVACCDEFAPPCRTSCTNALGFTTDEPPLVEDSVYLYPDESAYGIYDGVSINHIPCETGLASIVRETEELLYTVYFDLNIGAWQKVALIVDFDVVLVGEDCTLTISATVAPGHRAVLQFSADGSTGWVDLDLDMSADEWLSAVSFVLPSSDGWLRLRVYVEDCTIGYGEATEYHCE